MPDMDPNADVIRATASSEENYATMLQYLSTIEHTLRNIEKGYVSQSAARDMNNTGTERGTFGRQYDEFWGQSGRGAARSSGSAASLKSSLKRSSGSFADGIEEALLEGVLGSDFKKNLRSALDEFADSIGMELKEIPNQLGKQITKQAVDAFKDTDLGKKIFSGLDSVVGKAKSTLKDKAAPELKKILNGETNVFEKFGELASKDKSIFGKMAKGSGSGLGKFASSAGGKMGGKFGSILSSFGSTMSAGAGTIGSSAGAAGAAGAGASSAAASGLAALGPYALIAVAAIIVITKAIKAMGPAIEGTKKLFAEMKKAGNRYMESRKQNLKLERKRLEDDVEVLIEAPFKILEAAAQKAYDVWDNNLRLITATQGYNKAELQDLMAVFAERIREEGLSSVVSAADITENLSQVLKSGLSGPVAEEFAYIATKLNAAIPTQDFFAYASDYATLVANAMQQGKSQAEAVAFANQALETYASNILYASRQLTGGVTTGLQNAQSLFNDAIKIVQTSRTGDISQISGVLTSISAVLGSIAPDLASSLTDVVVRAATGGNADELVALRSLAGVNASNTEFLRQLAADPKSLFVELFNNLGQMQKMSEGAYMEVAEGLSGIFGVSMEALSRVDFNYLASVISEMNVSNAALDENMQLLASGQTTLTAEQLKTQQINKYMIEEGLSYVLDNAAARSIQENMWAEQRARALMEAEYSVNLKGSALEALEGIKQTVINLLNILNPLAWIGKIANLVTTADEASGHERDIRQLLELGRVGRGNLTAGEQTALYNLTHRGEDLNLSPHLVELMGGTSAYAAAHSGLVSGATMAMLPLLLASAPALLSASPLLTTAGGAALLASLLSGNSTSARTVGGGIASQYTWGSVRKSTAAALANAFGGGTSFTAVSETSAQSDLVGRLNEMLDQSYINSFVESGKGYNEWAATAARYGIKDLGAAIQEAGLTESQIQSYFEQQQTQQAQEAQKASKLDEQDFRDKGREFWINQLSRMDQTLERIDNTNSLLQSILDGQTEFYQSRFAGWVSSWDAFYTKWVNYFVEHTYYNDRTGLDYAHIRAQEHAESNGAIYALAEAFNQGVADISDPTVQTNALLSKILLVVSSIMQQTAARGGSALSDTLNALAMGITTTTP